MDNNLEKMQSFFTEQINATLRKSSKGRNKDIRY